MATPAQIANDMAAHAQYWAKRDKNIEHLCRDAERVLRALIAGKQVDGRTFYGVERRLVDRARSLEDWTTRGYPDFDRARICMERLRAEAAQS